MIHSRKLLAAEAAACTHVLGSALLLVAKPLLIYLVLQLLGAALVLLNVIEYPLTQLLMSILIVKEALSRIVVVHELVVLGANKLHISVLTPDIDHFLLPLFSLFSFLHALDCLPGNTVADGFAAAAKDRERVQPRIISEDLLQVVA